MVGGRRGRNPSHLMAKMEILQRHPGGHNRLGSSDNMTARTGGRGSGGRPLWSQSGKGKLGTRFKRSRTVALTLPQTESQKGIDNSSELTRLTALRQFKFKCASSNQGCYGPQGTSIEYRMEVGGVVMEPTLAGGAPTVHLAGHILLKYPPPEVFWNRHAGTARCGYCGSPQWLLESLSSCGRF
jgi:hypothetical protein